jgi:O-antigen ligase
LINAIVGLMQFGGLIPAHENEFYTGFPKGYSSLVLFLNLGIVVSSYYFKRSDTRRLKTLYIFLLAFYIAHLFVLYSRSGYLTFAILSPLIAYNLSSGRGKASIVLINILLLVTMSLSPVIQERIKSTIEDIRVQLHSDEELRWGDKYSKGGVKQRIDRIFMWRKAIEFFLEHPITGVGTGGYKKSIILKGGKRGIAHPHNNLLHMVVSFGIIGIILFIWFFWMFFKRSWAYRKTEAGFFIVMYGVIFLITGLFDTPIINADSAYLLSVVTGLTHSLVPEDHFT